MILKTKNDKFILEVGGSSVETTEEYPSAKQFKNWQQAKKAAWTAARILREDVQVISRYGFEDEKISLTAKPLMI